MRRFSFVVKRLIQSKFLTPRREKAFDGLTAPFIHKGSGGFKFMLHPPEHIDRYIFSEGIYEFRFLRFIRSLFSNGGVALDIGANIGNHAIYLSDTFKEIYCFEPNPTVLERLEKNIRLNPIKNIHVNPIGLSNAEARLPFRSDESGNLGQSSFLNAQHDGDDPDISILQVRPGDAVIAELGIDAIDFVKIDVEGHEPEVFEGLRKSIARFRPVIAFEFHAQDAAADDWDRITSSLPNYVFAEADHAPATASLWKKSLWNYRHLGWPVLRTFDMPERRSYANILAFPSRESCERAKSLCN